MISQKTIEWTGSVMGLIGAFLLAINTQISGWGFVAFLISNLFWIAFAFRQKAWGLLTMQAGFTASSVLGIVRWF